ncbi:pyruvate, water dikinase regulatory protein [Candidatus Albibeggiatoa sp. nov. NOAA]|uniref:posphoenolpyruvate synthetase regulatory kinase/phosphorylase PpsR n=1 Tax=Candidatus Albibeggiatoa sp. nov. NOAA TaxID=3162724 RepID=UPI0032F8EE26|nr:kinase/pyrophosphorylase [Thiotrichaceae bacterium]
MTHSKRIIFFISDGTGITAKTLGHSLLTQFEQIKFDTVTIPYIKTAEQAQEAVDKINQTAKEGTRPIVFATLLDPAMRHIISTSNALFLDLFATFIQPLEYEFQTKSSHAIGKSHTVNTAYNERIEAINFALLHDDGQSYQRYEDADVILVGVSRSGKTPTCLYLAMQFGVFAANYPLTDDDIQTQALPEMLLPYREKLFGLTIQPDRLQKIRQERSPNSRYSSLAQCQLEVQKVEALYRQFKLPFINTTVTSVEEIATSILLNAKIERPMF